jgi:hypothetical protein
MDDLNTSDQLEELEEAAVEFTTREDYIGCAYNAISAVEGLDTGMMNKTDALRVKRIIRKSLRIIDECVNEMYDELFEDEEE